MKKKLISSVLLGLCLTLGCAAPAMADSRKVVTLGADLSADQMNTMMRYFGVSYDSVDVIYINNTDERNHLGAYVPLEQIGNYTYSCALVAPTSSGGIQVKTANLSWVTCNMIASTLSTSGVTNCQVVAACPFQVSGTGALTGVIMAYENASKTTLDPVKVELANEELVATGNLANDVGQSKATAVINETKTQVIENNITNIEEIHNVINEVSNEYDVDITNDQSEQISALMQRIAEQEYDITQLKATLDRVQANVAGDAGASEEEQKAAEEQAQASEQAALEEAQKKMEEAKQQLEENGYYEDENGVIIVDDLEDWTEDEGDSILENTDPSALEDDLGGSVEEVDTTQTVVEQQEQQTEEEGNFWDDWDIVTGGLDEETTEAQQETQPAEGEELLPEGDADTGVEILPEGGADTGVEVLPEGGADTGVEVLPEGGADAGLETLPEGGADTGLETLPEGGEAQTEEKMQGLSEENLSAEDKAVYDEAKDAIGQAFAAAVVTSEDGSRQVFLTEDAAKKVPEKVDEYLLKVMTLGAEAVAAQEAADPAISQTIVQDTAQMAPDRLYDDEDVEQIDKYVRRLIFNDAESLLAESYLEDADKPVLYDAIMAAVEKAYGIEDEIEEAPEDLSAADAEAADGEGEDAADEIIDGEISGDEFADFDEEMGTF